MSSAGPGAGSTWTRASRACRAFSARVASRIYKAGADGELVDLMQRAAEATAGHPGTHVDEVYRQPLAVFRRADLGARRFRGGRPAAD